MTLQFDTSRFLLRVQVLLIIITANVVLSESDHYDHASNIWDRHSAEEAFLTLWNLPIKSCVEECQLRKACRAVNYCRARRSCQLLETDDGALVSQKVSNVFNVFVRMSDVKMTPSQEQTLSACSNCNINETCLPHNSSCIVKECRKLNVANGVILGNMLNVGARAKVECNDLYELDPPSQDQTVCQTDGQWTPAITCEPNTKCRKLNVANGVILGNMLNVGARAKVECNDLYELDPPSQDQTVCQTDGQWTPAITCEPNTTCGPPPTVDDATFVKFTNVSNVINAVYECDVGYDTPSALNDTSVECLSNTTWRPSGFKCLAVCGVPPNVTHASVPAGDNLHGFTKMYTCDTGYAVNGSANITCQADATWSPIQFECIVGQLVGGCPGGFHPHEEKCYFVSTAEGSWADAMKTCQSQGGQLALVTDQETQIFLAGLVEFTDKKSSVSYHTGNYYVYHYLHDLGVNVMGHTSVTFNVRACHDAHIALSRDKNNDSAYTYEIVIGGWSGSQSVIRDCKQCQHMVHHQSHPVSCTDQRPFWISWAHNVIRVGTGNDVGVSQFMAWNDTDPHAVNYVAIATGWGITGDWTFPLRTYMPGKFWVGATDLATEGEWLWLPDQTLIRAFTDWAPGEPNPGPGAGRCLVLDMHNNMQWRADTCEEMRNFICEKERQGDVSGIIG